MYVCPPFLATFESLRRLGTMTDEAAGLALLPPLWDIAAGYLNLAERWYFAGVKFLRLTPVDLVCGTDAQPRVIDPLLDLIIEGDDVHILEALCRDSGGWFFRHVVIEKMIRLGRPKMLEFVHVRRPDDLVDFYRSFAGAGVAAAEAGSLKVLNWEQRRGYNLWTGHTAQALIHGGRLSVLERLRQGKRKCPVGPAALACAIYDGRVDAVRWLRTAGVNVLDIDYPYCINTVAMLKYFLEESGLECPMAYLLENSLCRGRIDVTKYLVENTGAAELLGKVVAVRLAAQSYYDDPSVLEYLLKRGFPVPRDSGGMYPETREWFRARYG